MLHRTVEGTKYPTGIDNFGDLAIEGRVILK
jgi:hypothetical protein